MGYISPISVHNLPRLCTLNVNWSNKRKWLYTKKKQEADNTPAETITDIDYIDDIALLVNLPTQAECRQNTIHVF